MVKDLLPFNPIPLVSLYFQNYSISSVFNSLHANLITRLEEIRGFNLPKTDFHSADVSAAVNATRRRKRRKVTYETNVTIARRLDCPLLEYSQDGKEEISDGHSILYSPEFRDLVGDHAYRRILLFYYQAVVYHNSGCTLQMAHTVLQFGKPHFDWSSAAHSALFPQLQDNFFSLLKKKLSKEGLTGKIKEILLVLGVKDGKLSKISLGRPLQKEMIDELLEGIDKESLLGPKNHFCKNLGSTVELPQYFNEYDVVVENTMRKKGLGILNRVSQQGLHPYQALQELVQEMRSFLEQSKKATETKIALLEKISRLEGHVFRLEERFTKKNFSDYLQTLKRIGECHKKLRELRVYTLPTNLQGRLSWRGDYFGADVKATDSNFRNISNKIAKTSKVVLKPMEDLIGPLRRSLGVIEMYKECTQLPDKEVLSGKLVGKNLVPMNSDEIFEQQLCLIKRDQL